MHEYVHHPGTFMDQHKTTVQSKLNHPVCKAADQPKATAGSPVLTFTDDNFTSDVLKHKVTMVEFYAPWYVINLRCKHHSFFSMSVLKTLNMDSE